jgi:O-antigen ligase
VKNDSSLHSYIYFGLLVFAATATASIALENLIWIFIALFFLLQYKEKIPIQWPQELFSLSSILFLISFIIGAIVGVNPTKSFQTLYKYLPLLLIPFIGAMPLNLLNVRQLLLAFVSGSTFCAVYGIGKHFLIHEDRINSFSGDKMVFGGMLMASLLLLITFLKNDFKNTRLWICCGLVGLALIFTQTRGAWVGFTAGFALLTWRLNRKWLLIGIALLVSSFFVIPHTLQERIKSIGQVKLYFDEHHRLYNSEPGRFLIWASGWKIIQDYPWGIGQGNLEDIYPKYAIPAIAQYEPTEPHLHNNFLQILAQNGWLGLGIYLFWIFSYYREALRFKSDDTESKEWNWTFLCLFSAILVWGLTEYTFSHQFMYIQFFLWGLQVALWQKSKTLNSF